MMDKNIFLKRLQESRLEHGLSQLQLGKLLGVSQPQMNHLERGNREASYTVLVKIADILGVSLDYLFGRTDDPTLYKSKSNEQIAI